MKKVLTILTINLLLLTVASQNTLAASSTGQKQTISTSLAQTVNSTTTNDLAKKPNILAKAAIAADAKTGQIIYAKNIDTQLPIASMTKMISMAIVIDQIRDNKLHWEDKIKITPEISILSKNPELSNVPLIANQEYTVRQLFDASIIVSANAAVIALADRIAGNQEKFVNLMKEKLNTWGIKDYHIVTSTGLNNIYLKNWQYPGTSDDDENTMTARGMAIVAANIVNNYPEFLEASKKTTELFDNQQMINWNLLLPGMNSDLETPGVDGLKTGTTDKAGACFAGTAKRNNWRLITVVMHADNAKIDKTARFKETKKLIDYAFNNFQVQTLTKNSIVAKHQKITVKNAKNEQQQLVTDRTIKFIKPKKQNYNVKTIKNKQIKAPTSKGTVVQTLELQNQLGYLQKPLTFNLVTKNKIEKANFLVRTYRTIKDWFN